MTQISVIIPCFNAEKYINECMESIINQTLKDIEIICVNDGSIDNSLNILKNMQLKDSRIKIINEKNSGAANARNKGFEIAKGEYVIFFDCDDYFIDPDALQKMYEGARKNNADITVCNACKLVQKSRTFEKMPCNIKLNFADFNKLFCPADYAKYAVQIFTGWPWDKLYKRSFLIKKGLKFQNLRHSNDTSFVLASVCLAGLIFVLDKELIVHRYHPESLAATRKNAPDCFYKALKKLKQILKNNNLFELYKQSYINYCLTFSLWHYNTLDDTSRKIIAPLMKKIYKNNRINRYKNEYFYNKGALKEYKSNFFCPCFVKEDRDGIHNYISIFKIKIKFKKLIK